MQLLPYNNHDHKDGFSVGAARDVNRACRLGSQKLSPIFGTRSLPELVCEPVSLY